MAKASKQQKINPSRVQTKTVKEIAVTFTEFNFEKWYPFIIALFGLPLFIFFFIVFAALQVFYLNRLVLVSAPKTTE